MSQTSQIVVGALATMGGLFAGALGSLWWARRAAKQDRRIPTHWPLDPRRLASSAECKVWHWLHGVFFDHHIMVKIPVTRFTLPRSNERENSAHWHRLLSGVYCTFTVCASDGYVIGCVDVPGPRGISRSNRLLKLSLLSQCGISYFVLKPNALPTLAEIRAEFLGEETSGPGNKAMDDALIAAARHKLRSVVNRRRQQRPRDFARIDAGDAGSSGFGPGVADSEFNSVPGQQPNSFIAPLDSRLAKLR